MGKRYQEHEKRKHTDAFRASGLTKSGYAEKSGITANTLTKWLEAYPATAKVTNGDGAHEAPSNGSRTNGTNGSRTHGEQYVTVSMPRAQAKALIQALTDQL